MARIPADTVEIVIPQIEKQTLVFPVVGTRPLILNRMSEKARHELLMPRGRLNAAAKATNLKHDPVAEYKASPYTFPSEEAPTLLAIMSSAFKGAMMTAALDLPGTKKAQIGRLAYVEGDYTAVYGVPKLFMSVTRSADIAHTPDIRTRAIVPRWAALVEITFVRPILTEQAIANLLAAGGVTAGVGDWRPEKGKGSFGIFRVVNRDDAEFAEIVAEGGRAAQEAAMAKPEAYDYETAELLDYWTAQMKTRERATVAASNGKE